MNLNKKILQAIDEEMLDALKKNYDPLTQEEIKQEIKQEIKPTKVYVTQEQYDEYEELIAMLEEAEKKHRDEFFQDTHFGPYMPLFISTRLVGVEFVVKK